MVGGCHPGGLQPLPGRAGFPLLPWYCFQKQVRGVDTRTHTRLCPSICVRTNGNRVCDTRTVSVDGEQPPGTSISTGAALNFTSRRRRAPRDRLEAASTQAQHARASGQRAHLDRLHTRHSGRRARSTGGSARAEYVCGHPGHDQGVLFGRRAIGMD